MGQRFEGKNLDEALGAAAAALGVERYRLTYHVVEEKRGFLGGVKHLIVEAEVIDDAPQAAPARPAAGPSSANSAPLHRDSRPARGERGGRQRSGGSGRGQGEGGGRGRGGETRDSGGRGGRGRGRGQGRERGNEPRRPEPQLDVAYEVEAPPQGPESADAATVRNWCADVLRLARLDIVIRTEENETQIILHVYGPDAGLMVGENGELLDAVQVLANKALTGRKLEKEIELNCSGFKERREEDLEKQARELADRVRLDGREQLLPSMSPIERRIIHVALQEDADVTTESRGDGFYKRVAIIRRSADKQLTSES